MTENTQTPVAKQAEKPVPAAEPRAETTELTPLADLHETEQGATLYLDLPGVHPDNLDININQNVLTITGAVNLKTDEGLQPTYMDLHSGTYRRQFTLGSELDTSNIDAALKNGVLVLKIPRSEQHKPRKIKIKAA